MRVLQLYACYERASSYIHLISETADCLDYLRVLRVFFKFFSEALYVDCESIVVDEFSGDVPYRFKELSAAENSTAFVDKDEQKPVLECGEIEVAAVPRGSSLDCIYHNVAEFCNSASPAGQPENVLDAATTLADPAKYNECPAIHFDAAKPILDFCKQNGIQMRGHTLIWYSQTPSWFFYENYDVNGKLASRELMMTRMENYIDAVINWCETNYPGVIYAWDVVNEAVDDAGGMRQSYWTQTIGEDYVEKAFEFARKHAPANVELFYNDYNMLYPAKREAAKHLVEKINSFALDQSGNPRSSLR